MTVYVVMKNYADEIVGNRVYKTEAEAKNVSTSRLGFYATVVPVEIPLTPFDRKALKAGKKTVAAKTPGR